MMDDYYAKLARETRPAVRPIRSVIPNGDDFRSRGYGIHLEARKRSDRPAIMSKEFRDRETLKIACRRCSAAPGSPCISKDKTQMGAELAGFHSQRSHDASHNYRRK